MKLIHLTLKNKTKKTVITSNLKIAENFLDRSFGLLLKKNPRFLLFKTRFGIHTFFLKTPIDVVVLDKKNKIVKIKQNLKPNRFFFWNPKFETVIELQKETLKKTNTEPGDELRY